MTPTWNDIRPVLNAFKADFPFAEAQAVLDHPELQDALLDDLVKLAENPQELIDGGGTLHFVGMMLLSQKRDRRLASPLLKLASGSADEVDILWGDFLTDEWGKAVAAVCSSDELKVFIENEAHAEWPRAMAISALTIQVYEGDLDRQSTIDYAIKMQEANLQQASGAPDDRDNELLCDYFAKAVCELGDLSHLPLIESWFAAGILDSMSGDLKACKRTLETPYEMRRERGLRSSDHYTRDAIASLSGAHCYAPARHPDLSKPATIIRQQAYPRFEPVVTYARETPKVGRNDPCPCGSGKKAKKCCAA